MWKLTIITLLDLLFFQWKYRIPFNTQVYFSCHPVPPPLYSLFLPNWASRSHHTTTPSHHQTVTPPRSHSISYFHAVKATLTLPHTNVTHHIVASLHCYTVKASLHHTVILPHHHTTPLPCCITVTLIHHLIPAPLHTNTTTLLHPSTRKPREPTFRHQ